MLSDIRYALRSLLRAPAFTIAAVAMLSLAIAVNTIVFTLLNSLLLRPLPVRDADSVVRLIPVDERGHEQNLFSYPDYREFSTASTSLRGLAAYIPFAATAPRGDSVREALGYAISSTYLPLL